MLARMLSVSNMGYDWNSVNTVTLRHMLWAADADTVTL